MTITPKTIVLALAASAVLLFGFSFLSPSSTSSPSSPSLPSFAPQESSAGDVTVTVTPKELLQTKSASFDIVFDTHSVNLDFDVAALASLTDDQGNNYGSPTWKGDPRGGHHRKGTLSFPQPLSANAGTLRLTLTNVAGIPTRMFEWNMK